MTELFYLCFSVNKLPDLTLTKYSVFDGSSVNNIMDKHGVFLRQLHRLGYTSGVYFHLLYCYNPDKSIPNGHHLSIIFYATSRDRSKLEGIREFLTTSVLSNYYDFFCYEIAKEFSIEQEPLSDGSTIPVLKMVNVSGQNKKYSLKQLFDNKIISPESILEIQSKIKNGEKTHIVCEIASDADVILDFDHMPVDINGRIISQKSFSNAAFLMKKDYSLPAQNRLNTDNAGEVLLYSIMEWEPCKTGRLYNVLKLMEGYDRPAVLRIDIFPVEHTQEIRYRLPYTETRRRISDRIQGRDDNSEYIIKSWDKYLNNLMKFPQFLANVIAFADSQDIAVMLVDSVAAEAVESGTYLINTMSSAEGFSMYESDARILHKDKEVGNYVAPFLSLYTLEEMRPMFSFPILYPGESVECLKETDPVPLKTKEDGEIITLGVSDMGYDVNFPIELFKKHAFIAGVPGSGKTNTMLYLVTTLWKKTDQHIPFLVLEPAKQEYRALAMIDGMDALCVFSPGADTKFPLHINPFQFPVGLTLAEHIANLNAVFAGAFKLDPPTPFLLDSCIEQVYLAKGWNTNERNDGSKEYPVLQDLYDALEAIMSSVGYSADVRSNIQSVIEVRIGSLLRREIGNVYNVNRSSLEPEEWLDSPVIIELEALGEGPANFMSLLISTLIREVLKIRKTSDISNQMYSSKKREIEHIIFYEEAHNLIGPTTQSPMGGDVDPKISATKYLVKMLAEVRALNEGIVIADQLPTAMAPEVLKNTGLKLGHRITSQDDRNLLGSTMSASADQLEEQGTFGTGQALIFYENLLKPYKMRVAEWEKDLPKSKYSSPSDMRLFERLKDNPKYRLLLKKSAGIMQAKMNAEFELLRLRAAKIKDRIKNVRDEVRVTKEDIVALNNKLERLTISEEIAQTKKNIAELQTYSNKKASEISRSIARDLNKLCRDYANQYYAYMTLSKNYYIHTNEMYVCTINNYLSLFSSLESLYSTPQLLSIVIDESRKVMADIRNYVDFLFEEPETVLIDHPAYDNLLFMCGNYLVDLVYYENNHFQPMTLRIGNLDHDAEEEIVRFTDMVSRTYFTFINTANKYFEISNSLALKTRSMIENTSGLAEESQRKLNLLAAQYESEKLKVFVAISHYVVDLFERICGLTGTNRRVLLTNTLDMLTSFRNLVNYRDREATTILSRTATYPELWKKSNKILLMEMESKFLALHQMRWRTEENKYNTAAERIASLTDIANIYYGIFTYYSKAVADTDYLKISLVKNYIKYLKGMLRIGYITHQILRETSICKWTVCLEFIRELKKDERISQKHIAEWEAFSATMTRIFGAKE